MNIALILGTARNGRRSEAVAGVVLQKLSTAGHQPTLVDVREHITSAATTPPWGTGGVDEAPTKWLAIASAAEAFIHIMPEYNHGYPGEWKLLVDSLGQKIYQDKPAYVVGVSNGPFGGARVVEHVQPVLWELGQKLSTNVLYISNAGKIFSEAGELIDETTAERIDNFVAKL